MATAINHGHRGGAPQSQLTLAEGERLAAARAKGAKTPTAEQIESYLALSERKAALEREARQLAKAIDPLASLLTRFVEGKNATSVRRCGFAISLVEGGRYPAWKQEFIRVAGEDAAIEVANETAPTIKLVVEKQ